jgi:hypothetical protein
VSCFDSRTGENRSKRDGGLEKLHVAVISIDRALQLFILKSENAVGCVSSFFGGAETPIAQFLIARAHNPLRQGFERACLMNFSTGLVHMTDR